MKMSRGILRRLTREVPAPRMVELTCDGVDEPVLVPYDALAAITAAVMPVLLRHGSVNIRIGWRAS